MAERYPYMRFVVDAGQLIGGVVAAIILLGGLVDSCRIGGGRGFLWIVITLGITVAGYLAVMVLLEVLRLFLDVEHTTRQLLAEQRATAPPNESV